MTAVQAQALSKKQVQDTANSLGALKGAPCTIKLIEETDEKITVTFGWMDSDGNNQTSSIEIPKGQDGFSPTITVKENTDTSYVLTITTEDGVIETPNLKGQDGTTMDDVYTKAEIDAKLTDFSAEEIHSIWTNASPVEI